MPVKGLTETSSIITIGFDVAETAANTFTEARVDLQLNPLDNEVFVVYAVDLDVGAPDAIAGTSTVMNGALTTTSQTTMPNLSSSSCIARKSPNPRRWIC